MSWSLGKKGPAKDVAEQVAAEFAKNPCNEPEETIRQQVGTGIQTALTALPDDYAVEVNAYGSQSQAYENGVLCDPPKFINYLSVSVKAAS
jgi:hypothetical protein